MSFQSYHNTISRCISCSGIGTKTNKMINLKFIPSEKVTGIRFIRIDKNRDIIEPKWENIEESKLNSSITNGKNNMMFIEHLMAAFWAMNITDIDIEIDSEEVPLFDGSAYYFIYLFKLAGLRKIEKLRSCIFIEKEIKVFGKTDDIFIFAKPNRSNLIINFEIEFPIKTIGSQKCIFKANEDNFFDDISYARTFCGSEEVNTRKSTFSEGWNSNNHVVYGYDYIESSEKILRHKEEAVRHKMLDIIGDLNLIGHKIYGDIFAVRSGHSTTHNFIRQLFSSEYNYSISSNGICQDLKN